MVESATIVKSAAASAALCERLCRLVAIRSVSREEAAIADFVAAELSAAGFRVQRSGNNIWTEVGDAPRPRLLLNSHLDTVPAADGWAGDPWTPRRESERIVGLGANDAKGCVTALIEAAIACKRRMEGGAARSGGHDGAAGDFSPTTAETEVHRYNQDDERADSRDGALGGTVVLALTAEEEISGAGLSTILPQIGPIDAAIVGEPTNLTPMTAQRGLLILKCTACGRTRHPANTPADTEENAIANAAADIVRLREFDWGAGHPLLGRTHAHVTMINGGVARNVIPDRCEFWVDVRTTPEQTHAELVGRLRAFLPSEIQVHSERLVPVQTRDEERIVQAVLRALPGAAPAGSPAMSDMVFLAGTPAVKIGPGVSARSHTPDEYVTVDELAAGAAAYERIVVEYFSDSAKIHHRDTEAQRKTEALS